MLTLLCAACETETSLDGRGCIVGAADACGDGRVCEIIEGSEETACFAPLTIRGRVFDAATDLGIAGARVVVVDGNGSAVSDAALTEADGTYAVIAAAPRDASGAPSGEPVSLRVWASGYQPFPQAPRVALPVDRGAAEPLDGAYSVQSAATDVALIALPAGGSSAIIEGSINAATAGGALVLAVQGERSVAFSLADSVGAFTLYDVPAGATQVRAYRAGLAITPADVTTPATGVVMVVLEASTEGLSAVEGAIRIVNAPGGSTSSVVLVPESTFDPMLVRGEVPSGYRAAPVSGAFRIEGVAAGTYVVLAAFENDGLVRDPDETIGGTGLVRVTVTGAEPSVSVGDAFNVTEALAVVSPGADGTETVAAADPTFVWADDSSEDGYELRVYDAFGTLVHEDLAVPRVTGGRDVSHTWTGALLTPGMIYQFRAWSYRDGTGGRSYISATEDLRGTFLIAPL